MAKRRIVITVERERLLLYRRPNTTCCARCADAIPMVSPEEAAALTGVSARQVYRWVEAGSVHFMERADQALLVCVASLPRTEGLIYDAERRPV